LRRVIGSKKDQYFLDKKMTTYVYKNFVFQVKSLREELAFSALTVLVEHLSCKTALILLMIDCLISSSWNMVVCLIHSFNQVFCSLDSGCLHIPILCFTFMPH